MILFVDETENEEFFIVTGLLVYSRDVADHVLKRFKKKAYNMPVAKRDKSKLFTEFKSTILDKHYQRIKFQLIDSLLEEDHKIIYSCYIKKGKAFPQHFKEDMYISMLSRIVLHIEQDVSIIFDTFNKKDFEERIVNRISLHKNVQAIMSRDSQLEAGLQIVDNMCSIIRLHLSETDHYKFYDKIEKWVTKV